MQKSLLDGSGVLREPWPAGRNRAFLISKPTASNPNGTLNQPYVQKSPMRINTNGEKDYRTDLYERTAERFDVGTKSGGIDAACEFST